MSNVVIAPFILLLIPGAVLLIMGKSDNPTASQRSKLRKGGIFLGIAFTYFGIASTIGTRRSPRPEVIGIIQGLRQFNGNRNKSSDFQISTSEGSTATLSCPYNGSAIQEGDRVLVRYLEFDHSILFLKVLSGPNAGWTFRNSDGYLLNLIWFVLAAGSFYMAYTCGRTNG